MHRSIVLLACLFAITMASPPAHAGADSPPAKAPDVQTALPPSQSPALSAEQIAKQASARTDVFAPTPAALPPGTKAALLSTSGPATPGTTRTPSLEGKQSGALGSLLQRDLGLALGHPQAQAVRMKHAPVVTSLPTDARFIQARAAAIELKRAKVHGAPASTATGRKPAPVETRGAVSASPAAKPAPATNGGSR
jgi:hypothetical protein